MSARFDAALLYAAQLHRTQLRKGTTVPYLSHLLSVSSLVLEAGGDEDQAIAGLLHDALEDQGSHTSHAEIGRRFGARVADIVLACSHSEYGDGEPADPLKSWRWRRERYLEHLAVAPDEVLLVSRADKLHNARAIQADLLTVGPAVWGRFRTGVRGQRWYYSSLSAVYSRRLPGAQSVLLASIAATFGEEATQ